MVKIMAITCSRTVRAIMTLQKHPPKWNAIKMLMFDRHSDSFLLSFQSCCILAVNTPRGPHISESAWSRLSWRIKTWQTPRRSNSWWPGATLSSRNWRLSISSGNIEPWRRGTTTRKSDLTHTEHQVTWTPKQSARKTGSLFALL